MDGTKSELTDDQPMPEDDKGWKSPIADESEGHGWRSPGTGDEDEKDRAPDPDKGGRIPAAPQPDSDIA